MSARAYLIRLAILVFVFVVAIPALAVGRLYVTDRSHNYATYSTGIWTVALAIALWRVSRKRVQAVGLPYAISLGFIPLVLADWGFVLLSFELVHNLQYFVHAPFLLSAILMLIALAFWPTAETRTGGEPKRSTIARQAAIWSFAIQAILAGVSPAAYLSVFLARPALYFSIVSAPELLGRLLVVVVAVTQTWAIVEARRAVPAGST
jgi:uncharacterized membrane protein YhaH (DUF805 family)